MINIPHFDTQLFTNDLNTLKYDNNTQIRRIMTNYLSFLENTDKFLKIEKTNS